MSDTLLQIAGLVNSYHNDGTHLSAAETLRAIADALGPALEPDAPVPSVPQLEWPLKVWASFVLGGWSQVVGTDEELLSAIYRGSAMSPISEVTIRPPHVGEASVPTAPAEPRCDERWCDSDDRCLRVDGHGGPHQFATDSQPPAEVAALIARLRAYVPQFNDGQGISERLIWDAAALLAQQATTLDEWRVLHDGAQREIQQLQRDKTELQAVLAQQATELDKLHEDAAMLKAECEKQHARAEQAESSCRALTEAVQHAASTIRKHNSDEWELHVDNQGQEHCPWTFAPTLQKLDVALARSSGDTVKEP